MKLALIADIHGNSVALDAVLSDLSRESNLDGYLFLGDYAAFGPDPVGVLERLSHLDHARFIRGNTDRFVAEGAAPKQTAKDIARDPSELARIVEFAQQVAWTQG